MRCTDFKNQLMTTIMTVLSWDSGRSVRKSIEMREHGCCSVGKGTVYLLAGYVEL